jgi:phage protein D
MGRHHFRAEINDDEFWKKLQHAKIDLEADSNAKFLKKLYEEAGLE